MSCILDMRQGQPGKDVGRDNHLHESKPGVLIGPAYEICRKAKEGLLKKIKTRSKCLSL